MAIYVMLSKLTDNGAETLIKNPERIKEVNEDVEKLGAKVLAQYAMLGPYDFLNIVEAADNAAIAKVSVALSSRGSVHIQTFPAIDIDSFISSQK